MFGGPSKHGGEDGSDAQKRAPVSSPDTVGAKMKTSTPSTSDWSTKTKGWLLEKPIPCISNDNFIQEAIFNYWNDQLSGHGHVSERTLMSLGCGDSSMVALDLETR